MPDDIVEQSKLAGYAEKASEIARPLVEKMTQRQAYAFTHPCWSDRDIVQILVGKPHWPYRKYYWAKDKPGFALNTQLFIAMNTDMKPYWVCMMAMVLRKGKDPRTGIPTFGSAMRIPAGDIGRERVDRFLNTANGLLDGVGEGPIHWRPDSANSFLVCAVNFSEAELAATDPRFLQQPGWRVVDPDSPTRERVPIEEMGTTKDGEHGKKGDDVEGR